MYTGTGSGYGNDYPVARWGDGAYSTSFTGYSSDIYPPDSNQQIASQASQPQTNQTPPSYRPIQPSRTYQHNTIQNTSSYFSPNSSGYEQNTDYSYPSQAGQQPPLSGYSTTIANSNEGKYRDTSRVDGHYPDYEQVETELDRYTRYQSATEEDYYSQPLGLNRSNLQGSFNTSLNIKRSPKSILKKPKQKGVRKTKYNQPRPVDTDTKMLNQLHSRQNSYNQSRKSNMSGHQHQSGIPVQPSRKEPYSQYPTEQYGETGASFKPNVRVDYKFGQKRPKKKKRKINPPLLSIPNFSPPSQRDIEPVSNRVEENDTESVHMRHELDVKEQQLKVASDLLTKQGEMLKRLESSMNSQMHVGIVPQRPPPVPDMYSQLSPGEGRNSSQITDDYWYQSEMPPAKKGRFSGTNTNKTHPPIENVMDTSPYYSKNVRRKMNPRGTGGLLITTQQGLKSPKQMNKSHGEMNTGLYSRPEDSERTVQVTERGNTRIPRSLPSPLLGSTPKSIASKYGRHCHQCGLEFFFDFSKHALHPMHMKRKTRILSGCKPCNVMKFKNYEEYLSHQTLLTHTKIKKIVLAHRDSKYPFQGVKVSYPQYDSSKFHGEDVVKEITSYYCEACEKLIPSSKKSTHLHSKSHYENWVLHLRIEKYKSLVARESELKKKSVSSEKKAISATTSKDETNNGSTKNPNRKGKKKNKAGKKNISITKKPLTEAMNQTVEQKPDSQSAIEKPMDTSQTSEATIDKPKDNSPSIEIINEAESEDILEIKADQPEVPVANEFIDLTDTVKAEDKDQEKSTVESNVTESVDTERDAKDKNPDQIEKDNCLNDEGQMDAVTAEIDIPQTKEIQETHQVESEMHVPESNQSPVKEASPVAVEVVEAATNKETTTVVSDDNVTAKAALQEMNKKVSPTKRRTRQSPRVRN